MKRAEAAGGANRAQGRKWMAFKEKAGETPSLKGAMGTPEEDSVSLHLE